MLFYLPNSNKLLNGASPIKSQKALLPANKNLLVCLPDFTYQPGLSQQFPVGPFMHQFKHECINNG